MLCRISPSMAVNVWAIFYDAADVASDSLMKNFQTKLFFAFFFQRKSRKRVLAAGLSRIVPLLLHKGHSNNAWYFLALLWLLFNVAFYFFKTALWLIGIELRSVFRSRSMIFQTCIFTSKSIKIRVYVTLCSLPSPLVCHVLFERPLTAPFP